MQKDSRIKLTITLHQLWDKTEKLYKLALFSTSIPKMKLSILKYMHLTPDINAFDFLYSLYNEDDPLYMNYLINEEDLYFTLSLMIQDPLHENFKIFLKKKKKPKLEVTQKKSKALIDDSEIEQETENDLKENNIDENPLANPIYLGPEVFCGFCGSSSLDFTLNSDLGQIYGPFHTKKTSKTYVHKLCALWSPAVFLNENNKLKNVEKELNRGSFFNCSACGTRGATLGCSYSKCKKTFHAKCAILNEDVECDLDYDNYLLFCDEHLKISEPVFEDIFCKGCNKGDDEKHLLVCEDCFNGWHIYCLEEKLDEVPIENWVCDKCIIKENI